MDITIHASFLPHNDPDASLACYRDTLGFDVRGDVGYGDMRWITVGPGPAVLGRGHASRHLVRCLWPHGTLRTPNRRALPHPERYSDGKVENDDDEDVVPLPQCDYQLGRSVDHPRSIHGLPHAFG